MYMDTQTLPSSHTDTVSGVHLTDDVICEIYYILANVDPPHGPKPKLEKYGRPGYLGWITLTHVCRQWRYVGIDLAPLWARITCVFPPDIKEILQRAKDAPLTVDLKHSNSSYECWLNVDFLERLVVRASTYMSNTAGPKESPSEKIIQSWHTLFAGRTLPILKTLLLTFEPDDYRPSTAEKYLDAPALRSLTTSFPRPVHAPHLVSLHCEDGSRWHWQILLDFIRLFPLLEQLHLPSPSGDGWTQPSEKDIAIKSTMLEHAQELTSVRLPYLKTLKLEFYGGGTHELLQHLDLPICTSLIVNGVGNDRWKDILSRPEMAQQTHTSLSLREVWSDFHINDVWKLVLKKSPDSEPSTGDSSDPYGSVLIFTDTELVFDLLNAVPDQVARTIQEFELDHDCLVQCECEALQPPLFDEDWAAAFARFSSVTVLHIWCLHDDIFHAPESCDIFPALRSIVFTFDAYGYTGGTWWDNLRAFLSGRKEAGRQLERLVFQGHTLCHMLCPGHDSADADRSEERSNCIQNRRITLKLERELVGEVVDERSTGKCPCARYCKNK